MSAIQKIHITNGVSVVTIPAADFTILCGCPADVIKHLLKRGVIQTLETNGITHENGPNAILLSDLGIQGESFSNMAEFPVLQILYRQGLGIPNHPNNKGKKPILIGSAEQVSAQLNYIHRGNYGLLSKEELMQAGATVKEAQEMMDIKLKFAFGKIKPSEDLIDSVILTKTKPTEVKPGIWVERKETNLFKISYQNESVDVDLNLGHREAYQSPLALGNYHINREYFAVVHCGEGDGWDIDRPSMGSILMYQGKIYLIDAGASTMDTMKSLGIGINEIEGLFHTHAHDDHFAGLPSLMRSDKKIKYYSTNLVRASVMKKLTALLCISEDQIHHFFDFVEIKANVWNNIDTLEVKPCYSLHPVENTVFQFRSMWQGGYKTYAHLADISSFDLIDSFANQNNELAQTCKEFLIEPVNLKKIDIGGGMIHGLAKDFNDDKSDKIVLAHTSLALNETEKRIGSNASFGMVDILIPNSQSQELRAAFHFFKNDFPELIPEQIRMLLNFETVLINPGEILLKQGTKAQFVYLVLTGYVEMIHVNNENVSTLYAGSMLGELSALFDSPSKRTYRSLSYVRALKIPADFYREFIEVNKLIHEIERTQDSWIFISESKLFEEGVSYPTINGLAKHTSLKTFKKGEEINLQSNRFVNLIKSGEITLSIKDRVIEKLKSGDYFGESSVVKLELPKGYMAKVTQDSEIYQIPGEFLEDIPVCRWKMLESKRQRIHIALNMVNDHD